MAESVVIEEPQQQTQKKTAKEKKPKAPSKQALALAAIKQSQTIHVPVGVDHTGNVCSPSQLALSYLVNNYSGRLTWDNFSQELLLDGKTVEVNKFCEDLAVDLEILYPMSREINVSTIYKRACGVARMTGFVDPVKEFVESLPAWDGQPRIESFFVRHFGVESTDYSRHVSKIFFVQALSRLTNPGSKADFTLVLCGPKGLGKSFFGEKIVSVADQGLGWFMSADEFGKELILSMQKKWIIEFAELANLRKREAAEIKGFLTKNSDTIRKPYSPAPEDLKRHQVFYGSTNEHEFLKDPTGNRRFLPLDCRKEHIVEPIFSVSDDYLRQVWSEALFYLNSGFQHWVAPADLDRVSEEHSVKDDIFEEDFDMLIQKDLEVLGYVSLVSLARRMGATEIWRQSEVRSKLRALGLVQKQVRLEGGRNSPLTRIWCAPDFKPKPQD